MPHGSSKPNVEIRARNERTGPWDRARSESGLRRKQIIPMRTSGSSPHDPPSISSPSPTNGNPSTPIKMTGGFPTAGRWRDAAKSTHANTSSHQRCARNQFPIFAPHVAMLTPANFNSNADWFTSYQLRMKSVMSRTFTHSYFRTRYIVRMCKGGVGVHNPLQSRNLRTKMFSFCIYIEETT